VPILRLLAVVAVALVRLASAPSISHAAPVCEPQAPAVADESPSRRLCDVLHAFPETRRAACCGTTAGGGLAAACEREFERALRERTLVVAPSDVERCAAESAQALAGCDWVTPFAPSLPAGCRGILHGRVAPSGRCRSSLECRDGFVCRGGGAGVAGVCAPPGAPGAPCRSVPDALATATRQGDDDPRHPECDGYCFRGRCAAFLAAGGECSLDAQCGPGMHCAARRCVAGRRPSPDKKKAGEPCMRSSECEAACLASTANAPGTCGMQCSAWPPAGYAAAAGVAPARRAASDASGSP
jgi:hypothetical protein